MSMRAQETTGDEKRHEDRIDAGDQQQAGPYHAVVAGLNDLETVCPELISRWDYEKNEPEGLRPSEIRPKVRRWAWWRCEHGHSRKVTVKGVVLYGKAVRPYCDNHKAWPDNDLATLRPELLEYWDWEKNNADGLDPRHLLTTSHEVAWWICGDEKCKGSYRRGVRAMQEIRVSVR